MPPSLTVAPPPPPSLLRLRLLALLVTVLWSSSWVLIRSGLDDVEQPLTFAGLRYGLATLAIATWLRVRPRSSAAPTRRIERRDLVGLVALGLVQYAVTQGAQFVAINEQPFATTNLLLAATPLLVALAARFIGEPITPRQLAGALLIAVGVYLYFQGDLGATTIGMIAATVGLVANAASALGGRVYNRSTHLAPITVTVFSMGIGAAALLVGAGVVEGLPHLSLRFVAIIVWLAVVNTAAAFTWWNVCLRHLPATEMAAINTTMSVQIPLLGWAFFGEALGGFEAIGLTIVVAAVVVTVSRRKARMARP